MLSIVNPISAGAFTFRRKFRLFNIAQGGENIKLTAKRAVSPPLFHFNLVLRSSYSSLEISPAAYRRSRISRDGVREVAALLLDRRATRYTRAPITTIQNNQPAQCMPHIQTGLRFAYALLLPSSLAPNLRSRSDELKGNQIGRMREHLACSRCVAAGWLSIRLLIFPNR